MYKKYFVHLLILFLDQIVKYTHYIEAYILVKHLPIYNNIRCLFLSVSKIFGCYNLKKLNTSYKNLD